MEKFGVNLQCMEIIKNRMKGRMRKLYRVSIRHAVRYNYALSYDAGVILDRILVAKHV